VTSSWSPILQLVQLVVYPRPLTHHTVSNIWYRRTLMLHTIKILPNLDVRYDLVKI